MKYSTELFRRLQKYLFIFLLIFSISVPFIALREVQATASETEQLDPVSEADQPDLASGAYQLDITAAVTGINADMIKDILADSRITVKTSEENDTLLMNLDAIVKGENVLRFLFEGTEEKLAFSVPGIDNTRYETDPAALLEMLQSASASIPGITPLADIGNRNTVFSTPAIPDDLTEEAASVLAPYGEYLANTIAENMEEKDGPITLAHLGIPAEGIILSWEPDAEELAGIFEELAKKIETDAAAGAFVEKLAAAITDPNGIGAVLTQAAATSGEDLDLMEISTSLKEGFSSLPSFLREGAESLKKDGMGDTRFQISEGIADSGPCCYSLQVNSTEETLFYGGLETDPENPGQSLCLFFETPDQDYSFTYQTVNTEKGLAKTILTAKMFRVPVFILTVTSDPSSEETSAFPVKEASLDILGVNISITFSAEETADGKNTTILALRGIGLPDEAFGITGADITVVTGKAEPGNLEAPSGTVTDISGYSLEQLGELFGMIGEAVSYRMSQIIASVQ